jgi:hypothetical protein
MEAVESARAGLSPKKGGREKEKKKTKEGGSREGKVPCVLNQEFLFWFTSIWVLRDPSRLKYRLLRDLVYEEAMCKGSSGNGLPYAARAVP